MAVFLSSQQLDNCCGVIEIGGFPDEYSYTRPNNKNVSDAIRSAEVQDTLCAMFLITLNTAQEKLWGKVVRKAGYKCVSKNLSLKTFSTIFMFVKKRQNKPSAIARARSFNT